MTNAPDKREMEALERVERRLNNAWAKHGFMTLTVSDLREVVSLARASSRPADQVPDMVERVARALCKSHRLDPDKQIATMLADLTTTPQWTAFAIHARAAIAALQTVPASREEWQRPYRTRDASGAPTDAATVGWNWISELAQRERQRDAALLVIECSPVEGGGKVSRLYRGTTLLAVATTFRDDMNFTVLVRWLSPEMLNVLKASKGTGQ